MKYGTRNQLIGKVMEIKRGTGMSQVRIDIPANSSVSSVMMVDWLNDLGDKEGDTVKAVIKAVNVLLVAEAFHRMVNKRRRGHPLRLSKIASLFIFSVSHRTATHRETDN